MARLEGDLYEYNCEGCGRPVSMRLPPLYGERQFCLGCMITSDTECDMWRTFMSTPKRSNTIEFLIHMFYRMQQYSKENELKP